MVTPIMITNIGWGTYLFFAIINACFLPIIYFFYPETARRSLEEIDIIFAKGCVFSIASSFFLFHVHFLLLSFGLFRSLNLHLHPSPFMPTCIRTLLKLTNQRQLLRKNQLRPRSKGAGIPFR